MLSIIMLALSTILFVIGLFGIVVGLSSFLLYNANEATYLKKGIGIPQSIEVGHDYYSNKRKTALRTIRAGAINILLSIVITLFWFIK